MSTSEFNKTKKELVGWIQTLTDDTILVLLSSVKLSSEGNTLDWWEGHTESDRVNIHGEIRYYQQGETMKSGESWNGLTNG